jgi:uncharacterized protein YjbJ (UPF0337 family)
MSASDIALNRKDSIMGELVDKIKGNVNEAIGKVKQQSNNPDTQAEGAAQELKGKAQQTVGTVKGALGDDI